MSFALILLTVALSGGQDPPAEVPNSPQVQSLESSMDVSGVGGQNTENPTSDSDAREGTPNMKHPEKPEGPKPCGAHVDASQPKPLRDEATVPASFDKAKVEPGCDAKACAAKADEVEVSVIRIPLGALLEVRLVFSHDHARQPHKLIIGVPGLAYY